MNWGYLISVALLFTFLLIFSQRIVERHKGSFRGFIIAMAILLMIRYDFQTENWIAYALSVFISFTFWVLIGRYNEVGNADEEGIKVYGLDD